jgi:hypothetical protein
MVSSRDRIRQRLRLPRRVTARAPPPAFLFPNQQCQRPEPELRAASVTGERPHRLAPGVGGGGYLNQRLILSNSIFNFLFRTVPPRKEAEPLRGAERTSAPRKEKKASNEPPRSGGPRREGGVYAGALFESSAPKHALTIFFANRPKTQRRMDERSPLPSPANRRQAAQRPNVGKKIGSSAGFGGNRPSERRRFGAQHAPEIVDREQCRIAGDARKSAAGTPGLRIASSPAPRRCAVR